MELREFHNALRILLNLDRDEIENDRAEPMTDAQWEDFRSNPFLFFIKCDDHMCQQIWTRIVASKQTFGD